jgi:hypothetical protein
VKVDRVLPTSLFAWLADGQHTKGVDRACARVELTLYHVRRTFFFGQAFLLKPTWRPATSGCGVRDAALAHGGAAMAARRPYLVPRGGRASSTATTVALPSATASVALPSIDGGTSLERARALVGLREELERRRVASRQRVHAAASRAFDSSLLYALSERTTRHEETDTSVVDAAIERARQAASAARESGAAADELASHVRSTLANLEQPERTIVERAALRQRQQQPALTQSASPPPLTSSVDREAPQQPSGGLRPSLTGPTASERLASSRLDRATRTLSLMRERATMLQLVLQLSRQEVRGSHVPSARHVRGGMAGVSLSAMSPPLASHAPPSH